MSEVKEVRPGTKQLRFALLALPMSLVGLAVLTGISYNFDHGSDVVYWAFSLTSWVFLLLFLAGFVALFMGIWKRIA